MHIENFKNMSIYFSPWPENSSELPMRSQQYSHEGPAKSIETNS